MAAGPGHVLVAGDDLDRGPHVFPDLVQELGPGDDEVRSRGPDVGVEVMARNEDVTGARSRRPLVLLRIDNHPWPTNPPRD